MPYFHHVDTVWRAGGDLDKATSYLLAGSVKFVSLDGSYCKALNTSHSHSESEKLKRERLSRSARAYNIEIGILMLLGVKQVKDA